jgi:hypothetical protein
MGRLSSMRMQQPPPQNASRASTLFATFSSHAGRCAESSAKEGVSALSKRECKMSSIPARAARIRRGDARHSIRLRIGRIAAPVDPAVIGVKHCRSIRAHVAPSKPIDSKAREEALVAYFARAAVVSQRGEFHQHEFRAAGDGDRRGYACRRVC